jgi:hypothetical protein
MKTDNIEDIYELSPIQKGILFQSLYEPELGIYFFQISCTLHGNLNLVAFEGAWQKIVARHPSLRTSFYWEDIANPVQVVHQQVKIPLEYYDWRSLEPDKQQKQFDTFLKSDRALGFDFSAECLMRLTLIRLSEQTYQFVWTHHFIIIDGWSIPLVFKDFAQFYRSLVLNQDLSLVPGVPYRKYIEWLQQQNLAKAENFWRRTLAGFKSPTSLNNLYIDNILNQEEKYDEQQIKLSRTITASLEALAQQHQFTMGTLVQGAWAVLLSRYSCQNEVVYGCTVSGRPVDLEGTESMVGMLVNTLPVRVNLDSDQYLTDWLKQLQAHLVEMRQYEYTPLVDIQGWSDVPRGTPLFESFVVFENVPDAQIAQEEWKEGLTVSNPISYYKTNYPLTIVLYPSSSLIIGINYDFRRFDTSTIDGILKDFELFFLNVVTNHKLRLKDLSWLTPTQQQSISTLEKEVFFDFNLN